MCGLCGLVRDEGLPEEAAEWVRGMARRQAHRGPDDEGFFLDRFAALGSSRLSIVDLEGGRQPIGSETGSVQVVFNGEIYNYRELRAELEQRGHRFATRTDTEVLVHGYEEAGPGFLARLNGIFAVAIWDVARRLLLLARDPLGVKPLYYRELPDGFAFASEIKALLSLPDATIEVDEEALDLYLAFRFVPSPRTLFRGFQKLGPGEMLVKVAGQPAHLRRFALPPPEIDLRPGPREWEEELLPRLRAAVQRQLMGDVPIGVLLSGGIDSAAVLSLAAETGSAGMRAYTVGFADSSREDEVVAAARTARRFGVEHCHVTLSVSDYRSWLVPCAYSLDEPVGTSSVAPYAALCALAAKQHKVVLCGQGADEPLGGYPRHLGERLASAPYGPALERPARWAAALRPRSDRLQRSSRVFGIRDPVRRMVEALTLFPAEEARRLRGRAPDPDFLQAALLPVLRGSEHLDPLARFLYLDARFSLADDLLLYGDKIAMSQSLEVRVPFLDLEFLRFVERIPARWRVGLLRPKRVLRRSLSRLLPPSILNRPKRNFAPPDATWMGSSPEAPGMGWLMAADSAAAGYCRREEIARLIREQEQGRRDRRRQLFALLAFELWHRAFPGARADLSHSAPVRFQALT
ncbi:MAG TPA: asparagine synthase (glutamine-hydrolyzing) [Candidatus Polarisedimenticolia bacterium]|nr:asparagine synthase (glutamine-hydrolyzing) [Candidatus Polarisedimenticolia bacterium]